MIASSYYAVFDTLLEGVQIISPDGVYLYVNETVAKHGRKAREEMIGAQMSDVYPGIEDTVVYKRIMDTMNNRQQQEFITAFQFPDGSERHFLIKLMPVDEGVMVMSWDVTDLKNNEILIAAYNEKIEKQIAATAAMLVEERKKVDAKLSNTIALSENLQAILDNSTDNVVLINPEHKVICLNKIMMEALKQYFNKEIQQGDDYRDFVIEQNKELYLQGFNEAIKGNTFVVENETVGDGFSIWFEYKVRPVYNNRNELLGVVLKAKNIDERKRRELEIIEREQKTQLYYRQLFLLNKINDIILTCQYKPELYKEVCDCIVKSGGYRLAWIGLRPLPGGSQVVKPVAAAGEVAYLDEITISLSDVRYKNGPTATVFRTGEIAITNNVHASAAFYPWLRMASKYGIAASLVLPLVVDEEVFATLNIYAHNTDAFDEHELDVLKRIAHNLSLAIKNIRVRRQKDDATYALNERVKEMSTIYYLNEYLKNDKQNRETLFKKIANLLPKGWQFNDECIARIHFDGIDYVSDNYSQPVNSLKKEFTLSNSKAGFIEVSYTADKSDSQNGAFLPEEYNLINIIAETIEVYLNKKLNQDALAKSEANLKSIFNNTDTGFMLLDNDGVVIAVNDRFISGYAVESGISIHVGDCFFKKLLPDRVQKVVDIVKSALIDRKHISYETQYTNEESTNYFKVDVVPVLNENIPIGVCFSATDITAIKKSENELKKVVDDLIARNRDLEQFSHILSHNVRAPLSSILGLTDLLKHPEAGDVTHMADGIEKSAMQLDTVIRELNTILQVKHSLSEAKALVDLDATLDGVRSMLQNVITEKSAIIEADFTKCHQVFAVPAYIKSVFYNLVSNALKYSRDNIVPHIQIHSNQDADTVVLAFSDNGKGIDVEKYKSKLFRMYQRFEYDTDGRGVGLFMVKTQVESMGGSIEVNSAPGAGTTFTIRFNK